MCATAWTRRRAPFAALGFQLTPRGHHTLGSMNHLMMFATDYLELLGFGEGGASRPELAPFPVGLNGLVFKTADADEVHAHASAVGLPILPVQSFSRPVELDGARQDARFRTTRLDPGKIAMGRVYFCEHLTPELVWRPQWQAHPNGARAISRIVVATPDPQATASLFRDLFGRRRGQRRRTVNAWSPPARPGRPDDARRDRGGIRRRGAGGGRPLRISRSIGNEGWLAGRYGERLRGVPGVRIEPHRVIVPARAAFNTTLVFSA